MLKVIGSALLMLLFLGMPSTAADIEPGDRKWAAFYLTKVLGINPDVAARHASDAYWACADMYPEDPRGAYITYFSLGWRENHCDFKFVKDSDGQMRGGPIMMDAGEVMEDAKNLGLKVDTQAQRDAVWKRFHTDHTFAVWVCVRHFTVLVRMHRGDVLDACAHHWRSVGHGWKAEYKYCPEITYKHAVFWNEAFPLQLACDVRRDIKLCPDRHKKGNERVLRVHKSPA